MLEDQGRQLVELTLKSPTRWIADRVACWPVALRVVTGMVDTVQHLLGTAKYIPGYCRRLGGASSVVYCCTSPCTIVFTSSANSYFIICTLYTLLPAYDNDAFCLHLLNGTIRKEGKPTGCSTSGSQYCGALNCGVHYSTLHYTTWGMPTTLQTLHVVYYLPTIAAINKKRTTGLECVMSPRAAINIPTRHNGRVDPTHSTELACRCSVQVV